MQSEVTAKRYREIIAAALTDYFVRFPQDRERLDVLTHQVLNEQAELCSRKTLPGHLTGSALVVDRGTGSALLIRHKFLQRWLQPGGHCDVGELPVAGARREMEEEVGSGLSAQLHRWHENSGLPLDIDSHVIPFNADKNEPQHLHHDWLYIFQFTPSGADGKCQDADSQGPTNIQLQESEVSSFKWVPLCDLAGGQYGKRLARAYEKYCSLGLGASHE